MLLTRAFLSLFFVSFFGISANSFQPTTSAIPVRKGKVVAIKDGDTISLLYKRQTLTIRLEHIDCPEKDQPYATRARQFISDSCFGKNVTVTGTRFDRNKRLIGVVTTVAGTNINKALVEAGLAWHYRQYSCDSSYALLEKQARLQRKGLWAENQPTPPWLWRKKSR